MRKLRCFEVHGQSVSDVLEEFNERNEEFGIAEDDVVSVSVLPAKPGHFLIREGAKKIEAMVRVVIVYWAST